MTQDEKNQLLKTSMYMNWVSVFISTVFKTANKSTTANYPVSKY